MKFRNSIFFSLFVAGILPGQAAYVWLGTSTGLNNAPTTSLGRDGDNGLAGNNPTINLVGGTGASSPILNRASITADQLFTAGLLGSPRLGLLGTVALLRRRNSKERKTSGIRHWVSKGGRLS
jgi:hypothetical protein